jgi:hypothetical protein
MSNTVTVACSLPNGLILELGLVLDYQQGRFFRTPAYKRVRLKGTYRDMLVKLPRGVQPISTRGLPPGLTEGVDRDFITEWLRLHPRMKNLVWIVEKPADLRPQIGDRPEPPLQPIDPTKPFKVGLDEVTKADFSEGV